MTKDQLSLTIHGKFLGNETNETTVMKPQK